jgi:Swt1-like HEPN
MSGNLRDFVFRGFLAVHSCRDMQTQGLLHQPVSPPSQRHDIDLLAPVQESVRNAALQMQRAYLLLFTLENIVRELIASRLEEADGSDWFEQRATTPMKAKVTDRKQKEERDLWHTGRNKLPIYYLDFGDLSKIIVNHWSQFEDLLPTQPWVQARLDEAEKSRNVIAHTNVLAAEEVDRLEMYLADWIKQIG